MSVSSVSPGLQRRLPGVRFDVPPPALREALPRMDIAFFVGYAACGPVDLPVAVESLAEFENVFGPEITLLEDDAGQAVRGLLHGSLRAFFSHGGRRAWVLRVAGSDAQTARFPLQALALAQRSPSGGAWTVGPGFVAARSAGSWADGLRVAALADRQALPVEPVSFADGALVLRVFGPLAAGLVPGETLRLQLDPAVAVQGRVQAVAAAGGQRTCTLTPLLAVQAVAGAPVPTTLRWLAPDAQEVAATGTWSGARLALQARVPRAMRLDAGEVVQVDFAAGPPAWLVLDAIDATGAAGLDGLVDVQLSGRASRTTATLPAAALAAWIAAGDRRLADWLTVTLAVTGDGLQRLSGLGPAARSDGGPSVLGLPDDQAYYAAQGRAQPTGQATQAFELTRRDPVRRLPQRFPLASLPLAGDAMLLALDTGPGWATGLGPRGNTADPLERDGLAVHHWALFAEPLLAAWPTGALADQAEALRLLGSRPRPLRGLHAAFGSVVDGITDEPTLLVVPDAVQPGWQRRPAPPPAWRELPPVDEPPPLEPGHFDACALAPLAAPRVVRGPDPDATGSFTLAWTVPEPGVQFTLQEAGDADFGAASTAYAGGAAQFSVVGKPPGSQFYRVRATLGARTSPWSRRVEVHVGRRGFALRPWQDTDLLAVHRLMLRTAAARGDLLAVLALPRHYTGADAVAHAMALRDPTGAVPDAPPPLGDDEDRALTHGALHHPWLQARRVDTVIASPPDGAIAGQLAASALVRGAWIAVANQPLHDVVALDDPPPRAEAQALLDAQVNAIRSDPRGFVLTSSETLSLDADWRPVNVRRLMCLLRRAALREGALYVFEPNGRTLQRTVERSFNAMLSELFQRGAFAGASAREAYAVVVGDEVDTPERIDAGQFHVDLKVAPALPLTFLRVRLARSGERLVASEER